LFLTFLKMTEADPSHEPHSAPAGTVGTSTSDRDGIPAPSVHSDQLLGKHRAVTIKHEGADYVLRATRNGKLILTK
jgi:hemin uptake protein HemP